MWAEKTEQTIYLPGEGVYLIGVGPDLQPAVSCPTMVAAAYQATMLLENTDIASIKAAGKSYNVSDRISEDGAVLDLHRFMGVGEAYDLTVRNMDGDRYQLGDHAPMKTWDRSVLWAANDITKQNGGKRSLPIVVYDQWDCPLVWAQDETLCKDQCTVDFGTPHEGLVVEAISMVLVSKSDKPLSDKQLTAVLTEYDETGSAIQEVTLTINNSMLREAGQDGDLYLWYVSLPLKSKVVLSQRFDVSLSGMTQEGVSIWVARAKDDTGLYPTHTSYSDGVKDAGSDACIQVEGYFNYLGTWGWADGKEERGEAVASGDLVQVFYNVPEEADEYFTGEAAFPVECTFGVSDIVVLETATWLSTSVDDSQWAEYGAVQLILTAKGLPEGKQGRLGKVVFTTVDRASEYTILVRQGTGWWDDELEQDEPIIEGIDMVIDIPANGGVYDLMGRSVAEPQRGNVYIVNHKKVMF